MTVGQLSISKTQSKEHRVLDARLQIGLPLRRHRHRHLAQQVQNDRNVVRSQAPHHVLVLADLAQVAPLGIQVIDLAQLTTVHQFLEVRDGRVIQEQMPHHEHQIALMGQAHQRLCIFYAQGNRLFHEHVFVCFQGRPG